MNQGEKQQQKRTYNEQSKKKNSNYSMSIL